MILQRLECTRSNDGRVSTGVKLGCWAVITASMIDVVLMVDGRG